MKTPCKMQLDLFRNDATLGNERRASRPLPYARRTRRTPDSAGKVERATGITPSQPTPAITALPEPAIGRMTALLAAALLTASGVNLLLLTSWF